jgi:hypothetical protein
MRDVAPKARNRSNAEGACSNGYVEGASNSSNAEGGPNDGNAEGARMTARPATRR